MSLQPLLSPRSIAVVGASGKPGSFGHTLYRNLRDSGFQGVLYPINPNRKFIETVACVPALEDLPETVDLAVILVPAPLVPDVVARGVKAGKTRSVLVLSGGFRESGAQGASYEEALRRTVKDAGVPMVGPNCVGIINTDPSVVMHAMFASRPIPKQGRVAFVSQSGALCVSILDAAQTRGIGFSTFISIGNKADVDELDLLEELGHDPMTHVILMYIEELSEGRRFIEMARRITIDLRKPIFALKSGRSPHGAQAARSHTGSLAGSDAAYEAILRQSGISRVSTIDELFDYATGFDLQPVIAGPRVAVVTNSGGPGIIAVDALYSSGLKIPEFSKETIEHLASFLPPHASLRNPCDMTGDADEEMFRRSLDVVLQDPNVDGAIVILTPVGVESGVRIANAVADVARRSPKTTLYCFLGVSDFSGGIEVLNREKLPHFPFPENAVRTLAQMVRYREILEIKKNKETPTFEVDGPGVSRLIREYHGDLPLRVLSQHEAGGIFAAYGLPMLANRLARCADDVACCFREMRPPFAMKVMSEDVVHKSDVGGVVLQIQSEEEAVAAYRTIVDNVRRHVPGARIEGILMEEMAGEGIEVIIGGNRDEKFGPIIMFGLGGRMVEVFRDVTFRMAPMWRISAERMIREIRGFRLLEGVRGAPPSDVDAAADAILRVSQLMLEHEEIQEFDINPLILYPRGKGAAVADGRMTLRRV